jgi:hypothetical protein
VSTVTNGAGIAERIARVRNAAFVAGAAGLGLSALCALIGVDWRVQFFRSYLWAYTYCLGVPLGCLVVLMIQHLTGGMWGFALRRLLEAATRTLPVLAVLFVPLAFGLRDLYEWADQAAVDADKDLQHKAQYYLNRDLVLLRVPIYFAVWIGLAFLLNLWSRREDASTDTQPDRRFRLLSGPGIGLYGLTMTFAAIDWVMSLEPHWYSTIYGPMFGMGQVLSGFSFVLIVAFLLRDAAPLGPALSRAVLGDCGKLLLAFVMVWTYLSFSQFLLIWSGNLEEEIRWYLARSDGAWLWVAIALAVFHFALPFALLLSRDLKRDPRRLAAVAALVLGMEAVNLLWLIMPAFAERPVETSPGNPGLFSALVLCPAALVGVGGVWLGFFLRQLDKLPLLPVHAPTDAEGNAHD